MTTKTVGKTLFLYDGCGEENRFFFELEGDFSEFNGVYINSVDDEKRQAALSDLIFDADGGELSVDKLSVPTRDWTWFVTVGFVP